MFFLDAPPFPTVTLHTRRKRQRIDDFGASGCWTMDPLGAAWPESEKNQLADLLFSREKGIGLSAWRFNIGAGSSQVEADRQAVWHPWRVTECFRQNPNEPYDWTRHAGQQWFLRAARTRGVEHLVAFANSPPIWLTKNGRAMGDAMVGTTNLLPGAEADYARFLADIARHFAREGLPFHTLSPVNEPCWDWEKGQEGCRYANDDMERVYQATRDALNAAGLHDTAVDGCDTGDISLLLDDDHWRDWRRAHNETPATEQHSTSGMENRFPGQYRQTARALLGNTKTRAALGGALSGHSYWTVGSATDRITLRHLLRQTLDRYAPRATYRMTEFCRMQNGRDLGMEAALYTARVIHHDLTDADAVSWHWWLGVSCHDYGDGLIYTDWGTRDGKSGPLTILPSKTLWALGHWSRFVRPGSRRIETDTTALPPDALCSAFIMPDAKRLVAVLVNPTAQAVSVHLRTDTADGEAVFPTGETWRTSEKESLERVADSRNGLVSLPPRSLTTILLPIS